MIFLFIILYITIGTIFLGVANGISIVEDTSEQTIFWFLFGWPAVVIISIFFGTYKLIYIITKKIKTKIIKR